MTDDTVSIEDGAMKCSFDNGKSQLACIQHIAQVATAIGTYFTNMTATEYYQLLLKKHRSTVLTLTLNPTQLALEVNPRMSAICSISSESVAQKPDFLTSTTQTKFWNHLSGTYANLLDSYMIDAHNLQHMYTLTIESPKPGPQSHKITSDLCKGINYQAPSLSPGSNQIKPSALQSYVESIRSTTASAAAQMQLIIAEAKSLCKTSENRKAIMTVSHGFESMNVNIMSHFRAVNAMAHTDSLPLFPKSFPVMLTKATTASDVQRSMNQIAGTELSEQQTIVLLTMIQNELISTGNFLSFILPPPLSASPRPLSLANIYKFYEQPPVPQRLYAQHSVTDLLGRSPRPSEGMYEVHVVRTPTARMSRDGPITSLVHMPNDSPAKAMELFDIKTVHATTSPHIRPETTNINRQRVKRNKVVDLLAETIGLASYDDVERLSKNEDKLLETEQRLEDDITTVLDKTNTIIASFTDQSAKLSQLYKSEASIKEALQQVLLDEKDTVNRLNQLIISMEILSDVEVEFSSFASILSLIPTMIDEIADAIDATLSQTVHPSILPSESIKAKIPFETQASIMTPYVRSYMTPAESYIEYRLTEYHMSFTVFHVAALPISHPTAANTYIEFDLTNPFVASNSLAETFIFTHGECNVRRGFTICDPALVRIHTRPRECAEALLDPRTTNIQICMDNMLAAKSPPAQKAIARKQADAIALRIFSFRADTGAVQCGPNFTREATNISKGYTDVIIPPDCVLYTSDLKLLSPTPTTDVTDVTVSAKIPNITDILNDMFDELSVIHSQNMTQLLADYATLSKDIREEQRKISDIRYTLDNHASMTKLNNFSFTSIDIEKLHEPSEQAKLAVWALILLVTVTMCGTVYCCCPAGVVDIIRATSNLLRFLFRWATHWCRKGTSSLPLPGEDSRVQEPLVWFEQRKSCSSTTPEPPGFHPPPSLSNIDFRGPTLDRKTKRVLYPDLASSQRASTDTSVTSPRDPPSTPASVTRNSDHSVASSPTAPLEDHDWKVERPDPNRLLLRCRVNGINHTWVPHLRAVYSDFGISINTPPPADNLIAELTLGWETLHITNISDFRHRFGDEWTYNSALHSLVIPINNRMVHKFGYKILVNRVSSGQPD